MSTYPNQTLNAILYGSGTSIGDTSITLVNLLNLDGSLMTMSDIGTVGFASIEPGTATQEESISFTGITQNGNGTATLTGVSNVLPRTPYTQTSGLLISHAGGNKLSLSNTAAFYNALISSLIPLTCKAATTTTQTLATDFEAGDVIDGVTLSISDQVLIKNQVTQSENGIYIVKASGAPSRLGSFNSDSSIRGQKVNVLQGTLNKASTWVNTNTSAITVGVTSITFSLDSYQDGNQIYAVDSSVTPNTITATLAPAPEQYTAGMTVNIKLANTVTGATTINLNGLGAKTLLRTDGTAILSGDLIVGQIVTATYDGTNFYVSGSLAVAPTPLTTKGDILTRSASAPARLGVGSNGQVLKADSAQTNGMLWDNVTSASGGDVVGPGGSTLVGYFPTYTSNNTIGVGFSQADLTLINQVFN